MSPLAISARDRRALVLGAALAVPVLIIVGVVRPYRAALAEARADLVAERSLLADEQALLAASERYPLAYRSADSALLRTTPRLFTDPDDVLATAQLESYIATHALTSRALVQNSEQEPARLLAEGIRMLEISVQLESDLEGLMRFLDALERGAKLVLVDDVVITRGEQSQGRGRDPMPVLRMQATIRGFAMVETPSIASRGARSDRATGEVKDL